MERGALIFRVSYGARSGESVIGRSAERRFKKGRSVERRCKKGSERGAEAKHGARSDDVKKGRSVERRCKKGSERGAEFTPGPPPYDPYRFIRVAGEMYKSTGGVFYKILIFNGLAPKGGGITIQLSLFRWSRRRRQKIVNFGV